MENDKQDIVPQKKSLFPLSPDDIIDNALHNLDERQAAEVTRKVADEVVRIAVEKRKAEYRNTASQEEMRNLINNANLLDEQIGDYKINSTFETASGTTNVEIRKSKLTPVNLIAIIIGSIAVILLLVILILRN
ncbi:MAG TPA: hypothetical protein VK308_16780 [Pyrinomonadaceae bacterium]|nr:hypothetical protein [Pyrinomonadaceae bacterium]